MSTHILIIDNSQELLNMFQTLLEEEGYQVTLSVLPIHQISEVRHIDPDLIILDFIFDGQHRGQQMLEMLKNHLSTRMIPLIVCTAAAQALHEMHTYLTMQNIRIIAKPFDLTDLLETIRQVLPFSKRLPKTTLS